MALAGLQKSKDQKKETLVSLRLGGMEAQDDA